MRKERKHPVHGILEYPDRATVIEVTICTENRIPCLANEAVHQMFRKVWQEARAWLVGYYMIMPEHTHFFTAPGEIDLSLERWIRYWKRELSMLHPDADWRLQVDHWDTRMRNGKHYAERQAYVKNNPLRKGFVEDPDDWPYQGRIFDWSWWGPHF
ncbi:MAG: transposase [Armatimonadota bacterium]